jgi:hypothetical protein
VRSAGPGRRLSEPFPMSIQSPVRQRAALQAAAERIKLAAREAASRCVDALGLAATSNARAKEREDLLAAQFELNRKLSAFSVAFNESLDDRLAQDAAGASSTRPAQVTGWESLRLVDDDEVEAQVSADRCGMAIQHACEAELRELDSHMGSLLPPTPGAPGEAATPARNPLRPEILGKALVAGASAVCDQPSVRKVLAAELTRALSATIGQVYTEIVTELRAAGVQPLKLAVRVTRGPGDDLGRNTSGYDTLDRATGFEGDAGPSSRSGAFSTGGGGVPFRHSSRSGLGDIGERRGGAGGGGAASGSTAGGGTPIGEVDVQLMALLRRLATLGAAGPGGSVSTSSAPADLSQPTGARRFGMPVAPNLIYAHRDELKQASTGALDHMVIDVVGSLFEQILSDPKVPPQVARQIARLQLPVLRVALGDNTFFSQRKHPVRRLVNRLASLACSFDNFDAGTPGHHFLAQVKELVQQIVAGDFDQMELYERKLDELEGFIAEQSRAEVEAEAPAVPELLVDKEQALRIQQRYLQQLQVALAAVEMPDFLRAFLAQVWSQTLVTAARREGGEQGALAQRMRLAARELVISVQPKGSPTDRKAFLMQLPRLMKDLNEGIAMIGWPEPAKKAFLAQLLPAHAESLKGQSITHLDRNLLIKQLDAIFAQPLPKPGEMPRASATLPVLNDAVENFAFNPEEAQRIGLVRESSFDWDGTVDIDLSAEPEIDPTHVDIELDGLPPADEPPEPMRGAGLADNVQLGFSYQMHVDGEWQKVKLSYVSPGRAFFVFTRGSKHQRTISMTARMLVRLCESNRLRAFENAYLIERATARARAQLAALKPGGAMAAPSLSRH